MSDTDTCPVNGCNLQGAPIPQKYIDEGYYAEGVTHYSRMIGVELRGVYDGVCYWTCPDCFGRWHRFPDVQDAWTLRVRRAVEEAWAEDAARAKETA